MANWRVVEYRVSITRAEVRKRATLMRAARPADIARGLAKQRGILLFPGDRMPVPVWAFEDARDVVTIRQLQAVDPRGRRRPFHELPASSRERVGDDVRAWFAGRAPFPVYPLGAR